MAAVGAWPRRPRPRLRPLLPLGHAEEALLPDRLHELVQLVFRQRLAEPRLECGADLPGVARAIAAALLAEAANNVRMVTVHAGNDSAARFWEAIGFEQATGKAWTHQTTVFPASSGNSSKPISRLPNGRIRPNS